MRTHISMREVGNAHATCQGSQGGFVHLDTTNRLNGVAIQLTTFEQVAALRAAVDAAEALMLTALDEEVEAAHAIAGALITPDLEGETDEIFADIEHMLREEAADGTEHGDVDDVVARAFTEARERIERSVNV